MIYQMKQDMKGFTYKSLKKFKISEHLGLWIIRLRMVFFLNYKIQMKDRQMISPNIVFPEHSPANQCY